MEFRQLTSSEIGTLLSKEPKNLDPEALRHWRQSLRTFRSDLELTRIGDRAAQLWNAYADAMNSPPPGVVGPLAILNYVLRQDGGANGGVKRQLIARLREAQGLNASGKATRAKGTASADAEAVLA